MRRKKWSELTPKQRSLILVLASVEMALTATAAVDLIRRPSAQVRGSKAAWAAGLLVQPVGPIAYLTVGRLPAAEDAAPA
jgi:hypothetical protein